MPNGGDGIWWPDEMLLMSWIRRDVKWNFISESSSFGPSWNVLNSLQNSGRVSSMNEYSPVNGMLLDEIVEATRGEVVGIKFRDKHFYVIPMVYVRLDAIVEAFNDLFTLVKSTLTTIEEKKQRILYNQQQRRKTVASKKKRKQESQDTYSAKKAK